MGLDLIVPSPRQIFILCLSVRLVSELFEYLDRLRDFREFLDDLAKRYPGVHADFLAELLGPVQSVKTPKAQPDFGEELTVSEKIATALDGNPWQTVNEIAEEIGVKKSIVGSTMYAKGSRGKFTSKPDPKNSRGKVWAIAQPDEVCLVGSKKVKAAEKRAKILDLIQDWLRQQGEGTISDIADGIEPFTETTSADFTAVVRTVANRAIGDGLLVARSSEKGNVYAIAGSLNAKQFPRYSDGRTLLDKVLMVFADNGNKPLTVFEVMDLIGRPQSSIQELIYTKHPGRFEKLPRTGPGKQTRFRVMEFPDD